MLADATALPFAPGVFDQVVAYNMLMDVADMPAAVAEAGRVLSLGGTLTMSLVHPFTDRVRFASDDPGAPFTVTGSYFGREHFSQAVTRDGHTMTFDGWSYPLHEYMAAFGAAGLAVTALEEPVPEVTQAPDTAQWTRLPMFLWLSLRPLP